MTVPGNLSSPLLAVAAAGAAAAAGPIKSVRFNKADTAYLNKTFSSAGTTGTTTFSAWVKRAALGVQQSLISVTESGNYAAIQFNDDDKLTFNPYSTSYGVATSDAKFRDPSAWYHVVVTVDVSNSTSADRLRLYVNGSRLSTASYTAPTAGILTKALEHRIGLSNSTSHPLGAYLADVYLIDGQALEPTSFGAFDDNGVWQAAAYSGTFGTNGFHLLDFANESTVGHDSSGNNNDFTANNISTTAGAGNDVLFDVPTNGTQSDTGAGGELSSNYPTMNPLAKNSNTTLSNGNLDVSSTAVYTTLSTIAFPSTGKFYSEFTINDTASGYPFVGIGGFNDTAIYSNANPNTGAFYAQGGYVTGSVSVSSLTALSAGDIVGVAYDTSNGKVWFSINGTYVSSGDPANGTNATCTLSANASGYCLATSTYSTGTVTLNAGQRAFNTNAPSGFKCLCTSNLPTPTIADGSDYFDTALWTGNGSSQTISGLEFSPDFVWIKNMSFATDHEVYDTIRGAENVIKTNLTDAEGADSSGLLSFTSDGWTLGSSGALNRSSDSIVGWAWDAGSSNASNSSGSITSTVRANIAAGFSVVTYTGNGTYNSSIGHGLGVSPHLLIVKSRSTTGDWAVYTRGTGAQKYLLLNSTAAEATDSSYWAYNTPETSVFRVGANANVNANGTTYVAYCFAPIAGYSAFGSYEGNGATDGSFVYTGFRPRWVMLKNSDDTYHWYVYDTARVVDNDVRTVLVPSSTSTNPTDAAYSLDILSNGFKLRNSNIRSNASGDSYIYAAFAENPFQANGGLAR